MNMEEWILHVTVEGNQEFADALGLLVDPDNTLDMPTLMKREKQITTRLQKSIRSILREEFGTALRKEYQT